MPILPPEPDCHPPDLLNRLASSPVAASESAMTITTHDPRQSDGSGPLAAFDPRLPTSNSEGFSATDEQADAGEMTWWLLYTKSRQEKQLMRMLRKLDIAHYAPQIPKRTRSPAGRIRTAYVPLFSNYVFLIGSENDRYESICTGCVQKATPITDVGDFVSDLRQIRELIAMEVPLTVESRIEAGQRVRVRNGSFKGYEGTVIRRENETRLSVAVRFMDQGVSVKLDDCQLDPI